MDLVVFQGIYQFIKNNSPFLMTQTAAIRALRESPYVDPRNIMIDLFFNSTIYISQLPSFKYLVSKTLQRTADEGDALQIKGRILELTDQLHDAMGYVDVLELLEDEQEKTLLQQISVILHSQSLMQRFAGYIFMEQCLPKTSNDVMLMVYFYSAKQRKNFIDFSLDTFQRIFSQISNYVSEKVDFYGSPSLNSVFVYLLSSRTKKIGAKRELEDVNAEVHEVIMRLHQFVLRIANRYNIKLANPKQSIERYFSL